MHGLMHMHIHGLLDVPDEILLQVLHYLDLQHILILRQTCTRLCAVTQDHHAWLQILRQQSQHLPLPLHLAQNPSSVAHLSSHDLEGIVRRLHSIHRTWPQPRTHYFVLGHRDSCVLDPVFSNDDGVRTIHSLEIFLDRWLLCIYQEKRVEIWDLDSITKEPNKPILCTSEQVKGAGSFSSAITHLNESSCVLTIAVSCHEVCHVMQVRLRHSCSISTTGDWDDVHNIQISTKAVIPFASPLYCLRALDPERSLLLLGLPSAFHLLNWETRERTAVNMLSEEEEELWNGVVGAIFLTRRHILVLKAHSLEICTLLDSPQLHMSDHTASRSSDSRRSHRKPAAQMSAAVLSHFFPGTTLRGVSFSRPVLHAHGAQANNPYTDPEPLTISLSFLAYDVLRGLFQCSVVVTIPPPPDPARPDILPPPVDVRVRLVSSHNMAVIATPETHDEGTPVPRSGFSHGARGFVSACALGPAGRRGVWVERRRGAVRRVVYAFCSRTEGDEDDDEGVAIGGDSESYAPVKGRDDQTRFQPRTPAPAANSDVDADADAPSSSWNAQTPSEIEGKEVYEVNSYDLRDDITHIAFSETTGIIALGTRKGDIRVLGRSAQGPTDE